MEAENKKITEEINEEDFDYLLSKVSRIIDLIKEGNYTVDFYKSHRGAVLVVNNQEFDKTFEIWGIFAYNLVNLINEIMTNKIMENEKSEDLRNERND